MNVEQTDGSSESVGVPTTDSVLKEPASSVVAMSAGTKLLEPSRNFRRRRALALSVIPGLGQFYNGEKRKAIVFGSVGTVNALLLLILFNSDFSYHLIHSFQNWRGLPPSDLAMPDLAGAAVQVKAICIFLNLGFLLVSAKQAYLFDGTAKIKQPRLCSSDMSYWLASSYLFHFGIIFAVLLSCLLLSHSQDRRDSSMVIELVKPEQPAKPLKAKISNPDKSMKNADRIASSSMKKDLNAPTAAKPLALRPKTAITKNPVTMVTSTAAPLPEIFKAAATPQAAVETKSAPRSSASASAAATSSAATSSAAALANSAMEPSGKSQQGGMQGDQGGAKDDSEGFDISAYLSEVHQRIKRNWHPPRLAQSRTCTIKFKLKRNGTVEAIQIVRSSGLPEADEAAEAALKSAEPFPPLPTGVDDDSIDIKFSFDFSVIKETEH